MAGRLGIHVLGPRFGESIVLELPDGGIGVVDSFAPRRGDHPVVEFLRSLRPPLRALRFFALTHPHADHCHRAAEILREWPPAEVWVFDPFPAGQTQAYYHALSRLGRCERVEAAMTLPAGSVSLSLLQFGDLVTGPILADQLTFRPMIGSTPAARFCAGRVCVSFLTPAPGREYAYRNALDQASRRILRDGPALRPADDVPDVDHNLTSGALLVEFGQTRALLMSDAEDGRWEEWLRGGPPAEFRRTVHFIKGAHHGSRNGYHQPLYDLIGDPSMTAVVLTPFNRHAHPLPTPEGVNLIRQHASAVYCTNRAEAIRSTGLTWVPVPDPLIPPPPRQWAAMAGRNPSLLRLLIPMAGGTTGAGPPPAIPRTWVTDATRDPGLWRLIRAEHRPPTVAGPASAQCFVSAYYDNQGRLTELHLGAEAGRLV